MPERGEPTHEWQQMGQPWRTEPEIDAGRQKQLALYRAIVPNIEQGIYPFKGVKLSRADYDCGAENDFGTRTRASIQ